MSTFTVVTYLGPWQGYALSLLRYDWGFLLEFLALLSFAIQRGWFSGQLYVLSPSFIQLFGMFFTFCFIS